MFYLLNRKVVVLFVENINLKLVINYMLTIIIKQVKCVDCFVVVAILL